MAHLTATLASVFRDNHRSASASWTKLGDNHDFSQLCSKYWGKKIEEEARDSERPTVVADRTNDIGPDCFGLDLGIEFRPPRLWVRQDYIRIYDYCSQRHEEGPSNVTEMARSVVITGQPGVGKSYWVTYAMRRRLGEQKPFLRYQAGFCYIFVKDGVFKQNVMNTYGRNFSPDLWAFIDADAHPSGVPESLVDGTNLYIMFTSCPERDRWKPLLKCTDCAVIVMNTWSVDEIRQATKIHRLTDEQQNLAMNYCEAIGPTPRICINFVQDRAQLVQYEDCCRFIVARLTYHSLLHFVLNGGALDFNGDSDTVFTIRRYDVDNLSRAYLEPRSAKVEIQLMAAINRLQRRDQVYLYYAFASVNSTKAVAGLVYKSVGHTHLQEGIILSLKPAIKRKEGKYFHWKFQREDPASNNSMDLDGPEHVFFPPNTGIVYEELTSVEHNRLYVPKARKQVALDSFFRLGQFLYLFQLTVANNHEIEEDIEESLSGLVNILPPKRNWRFVFITPPGCEADVKATPEVEKFLEGMTVYTAHLNIEEAPLGLFSAFWLKLPLLPTLVTAATFSWFSRIFSSLNTQ